MRSMRFPVRGGVGCAVVIAFAALVAAPNASSKPVARQFASSAQNVDLGVTIARRPDRVLIYTQVTYQVTLTNHGPDTAYEGAGISIDTTLDSPGARVESIVADRDGTCTGTSCLWSGPIASGDTRTATV